jgi:hypothetical protein
MPYYPSTAQSNNARFPRPPTPTPGVVNVFPNDLIANGRNFYTQIIFYDYSWQMQFAPSTISGVLGTVNSVISGINTVANALGISGGIRPASVNPIVQAGSGLLLPIPKTINDNTVLTWKEDEFGNIPGVNVLQKGISFTSFLTGQGINPFLFMFFQRPNFKEFVLKWVLTPNTPQESATILNIVNTCKKASLPTRVVGGLELRYPLIAYITLYPDALQQHLRFKPCALVSVQADYTGAGTPSFFKGTNLPTVVTLSLSLKEIQLWDSSDIQNNVLV